MYKYIQMRGYKAPFESLPIYKTNNCLNEILKLPD